MLAFVLGFLLWQTACSLSPTSVPVKSFEAHPKSSLVGLSALQKEQLIIKNMVLTQAARTQAFPAQQPTKLVPMEPKSYFAETVTKEFPSAVCMNRQALLDTAPEYDIPEPYLDNRLVQDLLTDLHAPSILAAWEFSFINQPGGGQNWMRTQNYDPVPSLCVFSHAVTDKSGNVCDATGCLQGKSCPFRWMCGPGYAPVLARDLYPNVEHEALYVISQFKGEQYFHFIWQSLMRAFVGIDFLLGEGKNIPVQVYTKNSFTMGALEAIGIGKDRIVSNQQRAKAVIYPEPVWQTIHNLVRLGNKMVRTLPTAGLPVGGGQRHLKQLTLVKRSKSRYLTNHDELLTTLQADFGRAGYSIKVFDEENLPPIKEQWQAFAQSKLVIAPHGAGLVNLFAAPQKGAVVEILPRGDMDRTSVYMTLAMDIGLFYHGLTALSVERADPNVKTVWMVKSMAANVSEVVSVSWWAIEQVDKNNTLPINETKPNLMEVETHGDVYEHKA